MRHGKSHANKPAITAASAITGAGAYDDRATVKRLIHAMAALMAADSALDYIALTQRAA
jgi:hypothetical protein